MLVMLSRSPRSKNRKKTSRYRAKLKSKNRRRVNRMAGRRLSTRGVPSKS